MCCGSHVFALFPFSILDTAGEGRLLAVYFSSYCDGMLHLSCSAQKICLIGSEDLRHRYVVMNVLEMRVPPPPRFEGDLPVLTGEELECWILDHCSVWLVSTLREDGGRGYSWDLGVEDCFSWVFYFFYQNHLYSSNQKFWFYLRLQRELMLCFTLDKVLFFAYNTNVGNEMYGRIVQLVRTLHSHCRGPWFESRCDHQKTLRKIRGCYHGKNLALAVFCFS